MSRTFQRIGPYSRIGALSALDGRSREYRFMAMLRQQLIAHVGGEPSAVERVLIERAVRLYLQVELMDERFAKQKMRTDHDHRFYLAWSNTLARTLAKLGLKPAVHGADDGIAEIAAKASFIGAE